MKLYIFSAAILDFSRHIEFQIQAKYQVWTPRPWRYYKRSKNYQYWWNNGRDNHHSIILATILVYGRHFEIKAKIKRPYRLFREEGSCEQESGEKSLTHPFVSFFGYLTCLIGQQSRVPIRVESRRQWCDAICNSGSRVLKLPQRGPVANVFWEIFDRIELVSVNYSLSQRDFTRFWTSWWCCN